MRITMLALALTGVALQTTDVLAQAQANMPGIALPADAFELAHPATSVMPDGSAGLSVVDGANLAGTSLDPENSEADATVSATLDEEPAITGAGSSTEVDASTAAREALPLPAIESRSLGTVSGENTASQQGASGWLRTVGALAGVLALLFVLRAIMVRMSRRAGLMGALGAGGRAPSGVLSVLGRYPVARGRSLVLMQLDTRVLLLEQSSDGFKALSEITDPQEVASILMKTRDEEGTSQAARFNSMLRDLEQDPSTFDGQTHDEYTADQLTERVRRIRGLSA